MVSEQLPGKFGKTVGEKLRAARVAQHYTQGQLASPEFSVSYISAIERGQIYPSLRALEILASRLGLTSTQLLQNHSAQENGPSRTPSILTRDDDAEELSLLEAEILIVRGEAIRALSLLEKMPTRRMKRYYQLQHRYLLGWAHLQAKHLQESETILAEAAQLEKDENGSYQNLCILNALGIVYAALHNYTQALIIHQRCLDLMTNEPPDLMYLVQIYAHMGHHHLHLEHFDEAQQMFRTALSMLGEFDTPEKAQAIYIRLCQQATEANELFAATLYAYKALYIAEQASSRYLKSELYYYLGQAVLRGDQQKADSFLKTMTRKEHENPLIIAALSTNSAAWHLSRNEIAEAVSCAQEAYALSHSFGDTLIAADALIMLGRVEYAQTHFASGDKHFTEGLAMLERLDRQEEIATRSILYARLLEAQGKEQEALTYFKRAFQSRQLINR